ncbi:MAG: glycosyltransferase family 2 protein [Bacteroidales bacterium]|nr:glycosyltransferase family 2 protein [Bacteroidales bacterium]
MKKLAEYENGLVSIAIPAYKSTYLAEAIESALGQTYQNIELIIVNDHSPHDLDSIVARYDDKRIRYYKNKRNLGKRSIVLNWNRCLEYAKGEYFVLLCDDDIMHPAFVAELLKLADKYSDCNVFHARKQEKDERTGEMHETAMWPEYERHEDFVKGYFDGNRRFTISEFLYRAPLIKPIGYKVFPVGFFSDDASMIVFTKQGGIASSQKKLMTFRFSHEHISSNGNYNIGKARAMKQFLKWAKKEPACQPYIAEKEKWELDNSIEFFIQTNGWRKYLTLFFIPWTRSNLRTVWIVTVKKILHR